jgi:hypothetical protein
MALMPKSKSWRAIISLAGFALLIALCYAEENWRGKRDWDNCKRELEARGETINWKDYIPAPVPDSQNFFAASNMSAWFIKSRSGQPTSNDLSARLSFGEFVRQSPGSNSVTMMELTVLPPGSLAAVTNKPDIVLRYSSVGGAFFIQDAPGDTNNIDIPIIHFIDVPITVAIENLARLANLNYLLDPAIGYDQADRAGQIKAEPVLSVHWKHITARQALIAIINKYGLQLIEGRTNNIARIVMSEASSPSVFASPEDRNRLAAHFARQLGTNAIGAQSPVLLVKPLDQVQPLRIDCYAEEMPADKDLIELVTELFPNAAAHLGSPRIQVHSPRPNVLQVTVDAVYAADYLAWSDRFDSDFDLIREALKRPYARMGGSYANPFSMPIPNFVAVRAVAQTLAQRAQGHLLLGEPKKALEDLTLVKDLCRLLEARPTGRPMTLVATMINVAVTGLYTDIIADGMRLNAWNGPQLEQLQEQLKEIDLPPFLLESFHEERAGVCSFMENLLSEQPGLWQIIKSESRFAIPRGWMYQNLVCIATLDQKAIDAYDPAHDVFVPERMKRFEHELDVIDGHFRPYTFFAAVAVPNYCKAVQTSARNQTLANEAQIACALERFHLANGEYPDTLDMLVPQFIRSLPHDLIGGKPLHYHRIAGGQYLLYSVGWNETDDGGQTVLKKDGQIDFDKGDWVWRYSAK